MIAAATRQVEEVLHAAGATGTMTIQRSAHLVGGARMAARARDGVVDTDRRVLGMENLSVTDGSTLPTRGATDPGLTITARAALAALAADRLEAVARAR